MFSFLKNTERELEKKRLELINNLKKGSLDYLLDQMSNDAIYSTLLTEKRKTETSNTDEISWYAYRQAEELNSLKEKEELIQKLATSVDTIRRKHIYFCLAHLCKNTVDQELFNFLMKKLDDEKDNDCRLSILIGISRMTKGASFNITPIKKLTKIRNRDLRINSIIALQNSNDEEVEDLLLSIFIDTKDSHTKSMITHTLESTGTKKSVLILNEAYKKTRDYGLRFAIEGTIKAIKDKA